MTAQPSGVEAYVLGREYAVMPIPIDWDQCIEVAAGPVAFAVEARVLTHAAIVANEERQGVSDGLEHEYDSLHDGGASLHVLGADSRLEYLRFDCFDNEPHYHYIRNDEQRNVVVRIDVHAEGDPIAWTLDRVASRLPEMLEFAGGADLAAAVRAAECEVLGAIDEVREIFERVARVSAAGSRRS